MDAELGMMGSEEHALRLYDTQTKGRGKKMQMSVPRKVRQNDSQYFRIHKREGWRSI